MSDTPLGSTIELRVRYPETDQMGVVYHANYLAWCDMGRTELIRGLGRSYADLEREGLLLAVSEASLRYHASARYDDLVRVETRVEEVRSRTVTFSYLISRVEGRGGPQKLVTACTTLIAVTREGATQKLPADLLAGFRAALSAGGA